MCFFVSGNLVLLPPYDLEGSCAGRKPGTPFPLEPNFAGKRVSFFLCEKFDSFSLPVSRPYGIRFPSGALLLPSFFRTPASPLYIFSSSSSFSFFPPPGVGAAGLAFFPLLLHSPSWAGKRRNLRLSLPPPLGIGDFFLLTPYSVLSSPSPFTCKDHPSRPPPPFPFF